MYKLVKFTYLLALPFLLSCNDDSDDEVAVVMPKPEIVCGTNWSLDCIAEKWDVQKGPNATIVVSPNGVESKNALYLSNPHDPQQPNPLSIYLTTYIKDIKKDVPYRISFYSKIKGYPDFVNNPGLKAFVYGQGNDGIIWYNDDYYWSPSGQYHDKDWSQHSFTILGQDQTTLAFGLSSVYDSTWISNLKIEEF